MTNKRRAMRFESVFPVILSTDVFGECNAMARNISAGGILIEMTEPYPLGTPVRVHFFMLGSAASIIARGEVKNHYFLNFADGSGARSLTGMAIKFTEFEAEPKERLGTGIAQLRVLH
jgi:PilZ domain